jgi:hypothetical protein
MCPGAGATCPTTTCGGTRTCVGGPLDGQTCTNAGQCGGCSLNPAQGSCALVQLGLLSLRVALNGVCLPRNIPPGDVACSTNAECRNCVGGTNNGKTCLDPTHCPGGSCTGAGFCQLAQLDIVPGSPDANNEMPLLIPQNSLILNPAFVNPSIGTVCVVAGGDGVGVIDCDGGRADLNTFIERDHNTTPGDPGNSGSGSGLADDATCSNTFTQPNGAVSRACIEGTSFCNDGPNAGMLCTDDLDCPMASCSTCNTDSPHPGICNSPTHVTQGGTFASGDIAVALPLAISILANSTMFGSDGLACTSDDTPPNPPAPVLVTLSTGTNSVAIYDANNTAGASIAPGATCGFTPCVAEITGQGLSCPNLLAGMVAGTKFGGGFPAFDTASGDLATVFQFVAQ